VTRRFVVTGTDTGIGKTVFSAALTGAIDGYYWKPVQAGVEDGGDAEAVARLAGLPPGRILPEAWRLATPCSPHLAAEIDNVAIDTDALDPPDCPGPLVIEGAGGALVPVSRSVIYADIFARWQIPVIVVARTSLGTINHSLLTLEALRRRDVPVHGIAFVGAENRDSEEIIASLGEVRRLGRLDHLPDLQPSELAAAFAHGFNLQDFLG